MKKLLIILLVVLIGCKKDGDGFRVFTVKANHNHCSTKLLRVGAKKNSLQFWFKINDTWQKPDRDCWDKVTGLSQGDHRKNSCRLVHMYVDDLHIMGMYVYADGERNYKAIDTLYAGTHYCDIGLCGDHWELTLNGKTHCLPAGSDKFIHYICRPYIGGDRFKRVSHDWVVPIKFD